MKKNMKYYKKILGYFKEKKGLLIISLMFSLIMSVFGFLSPLINTRLITSITNVTINSIIFYTILDILLSLIQNVFSKISWRINRKIRNHVDLKIKKETTEGLFNLEVNNFDKKGITFFTSIIESEPGKLSGIFRSLESNITSFLTNIGVYIYLFMLSPYIGLFFIVYGIADYFLEKIRIKRWRKFDEYFWNLRTKYSSNFINIILGIKDVKSLNIEKTLLDKTIDEQVNYEKEQYEFDKKNDRFNIFFSGINYIFDFLVLMIGIILIKNGKLDGANLIVVYMYRYKATGVISTITGFYNTIVEFNVSANRLYGILDGVEYTREKYGKVNIKELTGKISIKNLTFAYDKKKVLNDVSLDIKPHSTVGFVGKSGGGKTTLFNCLSKLYAVNDGMIFFDDVDINNLNKKSLRGNISVVTQNPYIFNMSIKDNLKLVNPKLTDKEIVDICKMCSIDKFIESLPDKYDTIVGENGTTLSGGQRQRIAIARSIARKTSIIMFDEATSALDNETQDNIQKAIRKLSKKYTILIIAHRLSTVRDSDKIFFIDKGKIIASGTHEELVEKCPEYLKLYKKELK